MLRFFVPLLLGVSALALAHEEVFTRLSSSGNGRTLPGAPPQTTGGYAPGRGE